MLLCWRSTHYMGVTWWNINSIHCFWSHDSQDICEYMSSVRHWPVRHVHQLFTTEGIGAGQSPFFGQTHQCCHWMRGGEVDVLEMVLTEELVQGVFQHMIVVHLVLGELAMNTQDQTDISEKEYLRSGAKIVCMQGLPSLLYIGPYLFLSLFSCWMAEDNR